MPIDYRILQNLGATFNPIDSLGRAAKLRSLQLGNQSDQQTIRLNQAKLDEIARANESRNNVDTAAKAAYQTPAPVTSQSPAVDVGGVNIPGQTSTVQGPAQFDRAAFLSKLATSDPMAAMGMQGQFASQDATQAKEGLDIRAKVQTLQKNDLDMALTKMKTANQQIGSVLALPQELRASGYQRVLQGLKQSGLIDPNHPEQYSGDDAIKGELAQGLSAEQIFQQEKDKRDFDYKKQQDVIGNNEKQQQFALTKRGQDVTARGQDMTDSRMRDANQIARDTKMDLNKAADQTQLVGFNASMDRLASAANELKDHPGLGGITGKMGVLPNIPGGEAANAKAKLSTLKSQTAFSTLQDMRNNSKTGGALGAVSDKEGQLLQDNLAALDTAQSKEEYQKALQKIVDYTSGAKQRAKDAVDRKYGAAPKVLKFNPTTGKLE